MIAAACAPASPASIRACSPASFAGRAFDAALLRRPAAAAWIPAARTASSTRSPGTARCSATPCPCAAGEVVERDGFVFADLAARGTDANADRRGSQGVDNVNAALCASLSRARARLCALASRVRPRAGRAARVASLNLAADEVLVEILPPERLVAVTAFADEAGTSNVVGRVPAAASRASRRRTWSGCVALAPDLVVVSEYTDADFLRLLERSGHAATTACRGSSTLAGFRQAILDLGARGGRAGAAAQRLVARYDAVLARPGAAARGRAAAARPVLGQRR